MHLILVRHGKPMAGDAHAADPALAPDGEAQARATAERLAREPITRVVSSAMRRADQTAEPLAAALNLALETDPHLGEVDRLTGRYASLETVRAQGEAEWARFLQDPLGYYGVDPAAFRADVLGAFTRILHSPHERTAVFTHGFPINLLLSHALGLHHPARFVPHYGSITRLAGEHIDALQVVSVNETAHMPARPR